MEPSREETILHPLKNTDWPVFNEHALLSLLPNRGCHGQYQNKLAFFHIPTIVDGRGSLYIYYKDQYQQQRGAANGDGEHSCATPVKV